MNFKPQYNPEKSRNQLTDSPKKLVIIHRENSADSRIKPYLTKFWQPQGTYKKISKSKMSKTTSKEKQGNDE